MTTWSVLDYQSIHRELWIYTIRVRCDCKNQSCMWLLSQNKRDRIGGNTVHKNKSCMWLLSQSCTWLLSQNKRDKIGGNTVHKNNIIFPAFYFYYLSYFFNSIFLISIKFICDWIL